MNPANTHILVGCDEAIAAPLLRLTRAFRRKKHHRTFKKLAASFYNNQSNHKQWNLEESEIYVLLERIAEVVRPVPGLLHIRYVVCFSTNTHSTTARTSLQASWTCIGIMVLVSSSN